MNATSKGSGQSICERQRYFFKTISEGSRHFHKMCRHNTKKYKIKLLQESLWKYKLNPNVERLSISSKNEAVRGRFSEQYLGWQCDSQSKQIFTRMLPATACAATIRHLERGILNGCLQSTLTCIEVTGGCGTAKPLPVQPGHVTSSCKRPSQTQTLKSFLQTTDSN